MQAVIDACRLGNLSAVPAVVISNNSTSAALLRAKNEGILAVHLSAQVYPLKEELDQKILQVLIVNKIDIIVLAGYMKLLPEVVVSHFRDRIINIHPALLPRHGGKGFYGEKVHKAVLESGDVETGVTIHLVNEEYDSGRVIAQTRIPVLDDDNVETLAKRVLKREHEFLVETLNEIESGKLVL